MQTIVLAALDVEGGVNEILGWIGSLALLAVAATVIGAVAIARAGKWGIAATLILGVGVVGALAANPDRLVGIGNSIVNLFT